jgi:outer membrane protein
MNLQQAVFTCDEGKRLMGEVQKYVDAKNAELDQLKKESDNLKNQLNVQGSKLTDEARQDLEDQIEARDTALQRFQQDTQKEIDKRRTSATSYVVKRMQPVIEKYAKEKGLSAVIVYDQSRDAWVDPSLNVTQDIIKAYNENYAASAPKPAPAATAAPAAKKP